MKPEKHLETILTGEEDSILDIGTGTAGVFHFHYWNSKPFQRKVCLDVYEIRRDIPPSWDKIIADAASLPFKPRSFNVIQCTETIEHIPPKKWTQLLQQLTQTTHNLIYLTTSDETRHQGTPQKQAEQRNPHLKFQAYPPKTTLTKHGFHILYEDPHHTVAFKKVTPKWESTFKDMEHYIIDLTKNLEIKTVLDVGTGNKGVVAQHYWENTKKIEKGYACDIWTIKPLPPVWTPLKMNALNLLEVLKPKSIDHVQACGFLEHLTKKEGYRFIEIAETLARKTVFLTAATYNHGLTPDYKVKIDGNPYHAYKSNWHWSDFQELGYETNIDDMREGVTFSEEAIAWKKL